jgi:hypothetical protein
MSEETVKDAWGLECPKCKSDESLHLCVEVFAALTPDGTEIDGGDHHWDHESACSCHEEECDWSGIVREAMVE